MEKVNTAAQMRQMDYTAMHGKYGIYPGVLMENAGHAVAERAETFVGGWDGKDVAVLCGKGNNGGDGFVIARHLLAAGARVYVYIFGSEEQYSSEARQHLQTLQAMEDEESCILAYFADHDDFWNLLQCRLYSCQVIIDAMMGTGFHGNLRSPYGKVVSLVNEVSAAGNVLVIAVDMPTGVNADTGAVSGMSEEENGPLFADMTVTFGALKRGLLFYPGRTCAGRIILDAIGMPAALLKQSEQEPAYLLEESDIAEILIPRSPDSHKGSHGTIGIVTGCSDMAGAALMAAHGAVRAGAGKVFLRVPSKMAPYCIGRQPEIMVKGIGGAYFAKEDADSILAECSSWSVIAMGPGIGKNAETKEFIKKIISHTQCPIVLDADALNLLVGEREWIKPYGKRIVMTPHLAEFSRLMGMPVAEIKQDIVAAARKFVCQWGVHLVLKGAPTLIVSAKTGNIYINSTGNAGMACGGMGDVLTGIAAAFAARESKPDLCSAACAAVYVHGAAGDTCRQEKGPYGFTPMEVGDAVPAVLNVLGENMPIPVLQKPMIDEVP